MYKNLSAGAIGVKTSGLADSIQKARRSGFGGVEVWMPEVADLIARDGAEAVRAMFAEAGVQPGGWFLPDDWRAEEAKWRGMLGQLPRLAKAAAAVRCLRSATYIWPCHDEMPLDKNWKWHVDRLGPAAKILADHGVSFGMEFIGTRTLREEKKHPFVHTMDRMLELGREVGPNAGLLLDCWHWYTSGGTVEEVRALSAEKVVYVHVNDAPAGIPRERQQDMVRELPGETGVIDITGFLNALKAIGYDGPLTVEPFKKELDDLPSDDDRLAQVSAALDKVLRGAGIP